MLLLPISSELLNCSMTLFWTSHLDLSRSLRPKKVKGGQRILGPKNNFGCFRAIIFDVNPKFQVLVYVRNVILNKTQVAH
jgi:hypothetical protein